MLNIFKKYKTYVTINNSNKLLKYVSNNIIEDGCDILNLICL